MKTIKSHIHTVSLTMFQYYTLPTPYTLLGAVSILYNQL